MQCSGVSDNSMVVIINIVIIIIIFFIMVKTYRSTLQALQQQPVTQAAAMIDLRPTLSRRTATTTRFSTGSKQPNTNGAKLLTIRSGRPGLHLVRIHQMVPPKQGSTHLITAYSIYRSQKDERLSWPRLVIAQCTMFL